MSEGRYIKIVLNKKDKENINKIEQTFTDESNLKKWILNKGKNYEYLKSVCAENKIDINIIIQSIYDAFAEDLYLYKADELSQYVKDFAETYKEK